MHHVRVKFAMSRHSLARFVAPIDHRAALSGHRARRAHHWAAGVHWQSECCVSPCLATSYHRTSVKDKGIEVRVRNFSCCRCRDTPIQETKSRTGGRGQCIRAPDTSTDSGARRPDPKLSQQQIDIRLTVRWCVPRADFQHRQGSKTKPYHPALRVTTDANLRTEV